MQRRKFIKSLGLGISTAPFIFNNIVTSWKTKNDTQNFLFIVIEDITTNFGCYDKPYILTPNIDSLAQNSVQFNNAYCQEPVCAASRASFLTGLRPETAGVEYPYSYYFVKEILPRYGIYSDKFFQHDYYVRYIGKIHHGLDPSFSEPAYRPEGDNYYLEKNIMQIKKDGNSSNLPPYETSDLPEENYYDWKISNEVISDLHELSKTKEPFCIAAGFKKPHIPFTVPRKYFDMYNDIEIPLAKNRHRPLGGSKYGFDRYNLHQYQWEHADPDKLFSEEYERKLRRYYFACITFVDEQIGKIMKTLEDNGMRDNTVILLTTDHGFHTGELNHWGKVTLYEESLKVPLLISNLHYSTNGRRTDALVELVDLMPTMLDLAELPIPDYLEGTSLKPVLLNPHRDWKKAVFSRQPRGLLCNPIGYSLRNKQYRYTVWKDVIKDKVIDREIYDLINDPYETKNIAAYPENSKLVQELHKQYLGGWKEALPDGVTNFSNNPKAPPPYAWGSEGVSRRKKWHEVYGGNESDGWKKATGMRIKAEEKMKTE